MNQTPWQQEVDTRKVAQGEKKMAVLRKAATLFNERGFDRTSIDDLAQSLGVTKPTIYYYFRNKDQILFECNSIAAQHLSDVLTRIEASSGSGLEKVLAFFYEYALHVANEFGKCFVLIDHATLEPETLDKVQISARNLDKRVRKLIVHGLKDGSIREWDPKALAFYLFGSFNWIARWFKPSGAQTIDEAAASFVEMSRAMMEPPTKVSTRGLRSKRSEAAK